MGLELLIYSCLQEVAREEFPDLDLTVEEAVIDRKDD